MPQVDVVINGRDYQIACGEGEEAHVRSLLGTISSHVDQLATDVGQVGQSKLLLFAALVLADELDELKEYLGQLTERMKAPPASPGETETIDPAELAEISALISRIDAVAERVTKA